MNFAGEAYLDDKSIGRHGGRPSKGKAKNSELEGRAPSRPLRLDDKSIGRLQENKNAAEFPRPRFEFAIVTSD